MATCQSVHFITGQNPTNRNQYRNSNFQEETSEYDDIAVSTEPRYIALSPERAQPKTRTKTFTVISGLLALLVCVVAVEVSYIIYRLETMRTTQRDGTTLPHGDNTASPGTNLATEVFEDCSDVRGSSGLYMVTLGSSTTGLDTTTVYCDMADGGGWTVVLRRKDASVSFQKKWEDYKHGFGSLIGNFWAGNEFMYRLTYRSEHIYQLRVDLTDYDDNQYHAMYKSFKVGPETDKYKLYLLGYDREHSNINDSMSQHNGKPFSTIDHDNDLHVNGSCSASYSNSGWWFSACHVSMLTGEFGAHHGFADGITWSKPWGYHDFAKYASMKIRPYTSTL